MVDFRKQDIQASESLYVTKLFMVKLRFAQDPYCAHQNHRSGRVPQIMRYELLEVAIAWTLVTDEET
jgi:hypothetical protein